MLLKERLGVSVCRYVCVCVYACLKVFMGLGNRYGFYTRGGSVGAN